MSLEAQMTPQPIHDSGEVNRTLADHDKAMAQLNSLHMSQQPWPGHIEISPPFNDSLLAEKNLKLRPHSSPVDPWSLNYLVGHPVVVGCCEDRAINPAEVIVIERIWMCGEADYLRKTEEYAGGRAAK